MLFFNILFFFLDAYLIFFLVTNHLCYFFLFLDAYSSVFLFFLVTNHHH